MILYILHDILSSIKCDKMSYHNYEFSEDELSF